MSTPTPTTGDPAAEPELPDVLYLPDVNIVIHAAEKLGLVWSRNPDIPRTIPAMLSILDHDKDNDALVDFVTAVVTRSFVIHALVTATAARVLVKDLGWTDRDAQVVIEALSSLGRQIPLTPAFRQHNAEQVERLNLGWAPERIAAIRRAAVDGDYTGISMWDQVAGIAMGPMYELVATLAADHLAPLYADGGAVDKSSTKVDGEDLGQFAIRRQAETHFGRPVHWASGDQEACKAARKAKLAVVIQYTRNHTTNRLHAADKSVRPVRPTRPGAEQPVPGRPVTVTAGRPSANAAARGPLTI